jgi:hypothetical protein
MGTKYLVPLAHGHTPKIHLSRLADIRRGFGTYERVWITAASKDFTRFVILLLHMEGRVPIFHHFRRSGLQLLQEMLLTGGSVFQRIC